MKDFRKFWTRMNINAEEAIRSTKQQSCFNLIPENQSIVFISILKITDQTVREREI